MLVIYEETIYPLPSKDTWIIPNEVKSTVVLPPQGRVQAGRHKKRRCKAPWELKNENRYGRCGIYGHNRKTCKNPPKKA